MIYMVDIDGTICYTEGNNYEDSSTQYKNVLIYFNKLYEEGNEIHYWTARGAKSAQTGKVLQRHN